MGLGLANSQGKIVCLVVWLWCVVGMVVCFNKNCLESYEYEVDDFHVT